MRIDLVPKLDFCDVLLETQLSFIKSRSEVDLLEHNLSHIYPKYYPIIAANLTSTGSFTMAKTLNKLGVMTCLHKHYKEDEYVEFFDSDRTLIDGVFYSLGTASEDFNKLCYVADNINLKNICIDVPFAHIPQCFDTILFVKKRLPKCNLMVGNISNTKQVKLFADLGVNILKGSIGSGGLCQSRVVAGTGKPQFSFLMDSVNKVKKYGMHLCSDGGIRSIGDFGKAFGTGASLVMVGSFFTGYDENEGEWDFKNELDMERCLITGPVYKKTKAYLNVFGMASHEAQIKLYKKLDSYRASEGISTKVPYKGSIKDLIQEVLGGLRSTCSYSGAKTLKELPEKAEFIICNRTHDNI